MNNRPKFTILIPILLIVGGAFWMMRSTSSDKQNSSLPTKIIEGGKSTIEKDATFETTTDRISDIEFKHMKVNLPVPIDEPWKGLFFDSKSCFDSDKKQAAVEILPVWIRQAMLAKKPEAAARYLWTLMKLSEDKELSTAAKAVFAIYRMGDYRGEAAARMRGWIESGTSFRYSDSFTASGDTKDIRSQILDELELNKDHSFDQFIYENWLRNQTIEKKELGRVDYAYYLEKNGRDLPLEYWVQRLNNPSEFLNALEIVTPKNTPQVLSALREVFEDLRTKSVSSVDSGRAASVAAALFHQTGDVGYRDYLTQQARTQLASTSFERSLPKILDGLAQTNDKAALALVINAAKHENAVIREFAIDALGKTSNAMATGALFEAAIQKAKEGRGFPARELLALLTQNTVDADSKYERLHQELLRGQLGWLAAISDFDALEFFRKHRRE